MCSVQFSAQSCPILCDPLNPRTPGLPVHHQLPEFIQTHVHQVGDAIQQSHPLSSPSPPAFDLSQNQGKIFPRIRERSFPLSQLFAWGRQSIGVPASASVLPMNTQDWSPLGWTGWISLQSKLEIYIEGILITASSLFYHILFVLTSQIRMGG